MRWMGYMEFLIPRYEFGFRLVNYGKLATFHLKVAGNYTV